MAAELERSQPGLFRRLSLDRVCRELVPLAEAYWTAEARWQEAFFDTAAAPPAKLNALLAARRQAAQRLMASRALLILARPHVTPVAWRIEPPGPVLARHAARLAAPEQAFPAPPPVAIEVSRELAGQHGRERAGSGSRPPPRAPPRALAWVPERSTVRPPGRMSIRPPSGPTRRASSISMGS